MTRLSLQTVMLAITALATLTHCRSSPSGGASAVKDLPDSALPPEVVSYRQYSPDQLASMFASGTVPTVLPSGYATGIHILPSGSPAQVPASLTLVTKELWRGKRFDGASSMMYDDTLGPDLGVKASLSIEPLSAVLTRHSFDRSQDQTVADGKPSLITDYAASAYSGLTAPLVADTKGWIDEFRIAQDGAKPIYLGRSTYNGLFWGYVVLQLDPTITTTTLPVPNTLTLADLPNLSPDQWAAEFQNGRADATLIPSSDHPGVLTQGTGYPYIFQSMGPLNALANDIWRGKNFITADGKTTLKNQFIQSSGAIQLFDAVVVVDQSKLDGQPIILLDYRVSGVPGINAIRDEIRLVSESTITQNGQPMRRRLYLGPTFLLPEQASNGVEAAFYSTFASVPILWFALEFVEPLSGS
jgi:hypothetical protein